MLITGLMEFDSADLSNMENDGMLEEVILHEMDNVIGIGTIWDTLGLVKGLNTNDPTFV